MGHAGDGRGACEPPTSSGHVESVDSIIYITQALGEKCFKIYGFTSACVAKREGMMRRTKRVIYKFEYGTT